MKKEKDDATMIMRTSHHIQGETSDASAKRSPQKKPPIPKSSLGTSQAKKVSIK